MTVTEQGISARGKHEKRVEAPANSDWCMSVNEEGSVGGTIFL